MRESDEKTNANIDRELVERALKNDQKAFSALVQRYSEQILSYISSYIHSSADAEDLCQECFNKAFRNLETYRSEYAFSTWLFNIAQNLCIDYFRKSKLSFVPIGMGEIRGEGDNWSSGAPSPEESVINGQEVESLIHAIDSLDKKYREVAIMRFIKEFAYEEIASELGLPLNTVRTRVKRAKEQIIKQWKS